MPGDPKPVVETSQAYAIIQERCVVCHSPSPEFAGFTVAPLGVELDSEEKLGKHAERVYQTVAVLRTMPLANFTQMTDKEREQIALWFENQD